MQCCVNFCDQGHPRSLILVPIVVRMRYPISSS